MIHYFLIIFTVIVTSLYYFPFELVVLPGINTKMALAVVGIFGALYRMVMNRDKVVPKNLLIVFLLAGMVSLVGLFSVIYNNTPDYAYATYLISMSVWLSSAFVVCLLIEKVHGRLSIPLVCHYLIVVSVVQCFLALLIDFNSTVKNIVDTYINQDQTFLNEVNRLYGIGAWLDVAGSRFSACLIMIAYLVNKTKEQLSAKEIWCYFIAYTIIAVFGNMVARTTSVGIVLGILYYIGVVATNQPTINHSSRKLLRIFLMTLFVMIPVVYVLYNTNAQLHELFRFGFEAFFNYVEKGEFETGSTNRLQTMYVFPESLKTWFVGDGYFSNPHYSDPYYVGKTTKFGYYMGTDVGYLRFIFYFGIAGLLAFSTFIIYSAQTCMRNLPSYKIMFALLLLSNFVIWLKVSTDIFLVFALFICVSNMQKKEQDPVLIKQ